MSAAEGLVRLSSSIRFITYNIRKGKGASIFANDRVASLGQALHTCSPDLVLCQEVSHVYDPAVSQSAELGHILGLCSYYEPNKRRRNGHHGNATFTRYPVVHARNYDVSTNRLERRGVLYLCLDVNGRRLHVLNAHLGLNQTQRLVQVTSIAAIVDERVPANEPVILAGDFNDWNQRLDDVIVNQHGFRNALGHLPAQDVRTWHARRPVFNLDRVYVRNIKTRGALRLGGAPWEGLSDHLPLVVELDLPVMPRAA